MAPLKVFNIITLLYVFCSLGLTAWITVDLYYTINPANKKTKSDGRGRVDSKQNTIIETYPKYLNSNLFTGDKLQETKPLPSSDKNDGIFSELYGDPTKNKLSDYPKSPVKVKVVDKPVQKKDEDVNDGIFTELYGDLSPEIKSTKPKDVPEVIKTQEQRAPNKFEDDFEEVKAEDENYGIMGEISGHPTKTKLPKEKIAKLARKFNLKRLEEDVDVVDPEDENYGIMSEVHGYHNRTKMSKPKDLDEVVQKPKAVSQESLVPKKAHETLPKPAKPHVEVDPDSPKKVVKEVKGPDRVSNVHGQPGFDGSDEFFE
ncbi:conserved hypothetical protein [Theileria orientalis strain Shintoku]|uniref:Uncharacterized protein n=1 Tax=Theileria orientalis strain Shintoku TaxID=869250 RepID=J4DQ15_THEOR|nr:conserved hypothetical protein [Theileria orientalis strain Shintoku]PVC53719.1 hypothetical protein MACL_00003583 [Theileria orientalis]BAM41664.1 conserved hypothetical protein [Theileria orientalis strain Shintoku]|eukprot:XP_009691965.1 conserved hypothetical protein [Theileria orientalis strain Shintoku]